MKRVRWVRKESKMWTSFKIRRNKNLYSIAFLGSLRLKDIRKLRDVCDDILKREEGE